MIFHRQKGIFVHIPRTGGTSIEDMLWPDKKTRTEADLWMGFVDPYHNRFQTGGLQHLLAGQIRAAVGPETFARYFKFALVRNPWDKAVSQYFYMKKRRDLMDYVGMGEGDDLKRYLALITSKKHVQWEDQYKFIYNSDGQLLVDFVGRFENYSADVTRILNKLKVRMRLLGIPLRKLLHVNKTSRRHYSEYYDDESRDFISNLYQKDIELFEYRFERTASAR